jgi:acyl-CoA dehydrogenase
MILVPKDTPGVKIIGAMHVFGEDHAPHGHMHIVFDNVRVPKENILLGEGRGFEISQVRLGPGRIHHCMRLIGCAQRALELMCKRASSRVAFGRPLADHGSVREDIAHSFCEIEQARLLTLRAADKMDREGNKAARDLIAAAKIVVPSMAARVIDRAIQVHGAAGVSQDTFLAEAYVYARFIRIGDGPDQVHLSAVGKQLLKQWGQAPAG